MTPQPRDPLETYAWRPPALETAVPHVTEPPVVTDDDRTWGAVAHGGSFLAAWIALGVLAPVAVLFAKSRSQFVRHHAYESLNFQLNTYLWIAIVFVLGFLTFGLGWVAFVPLGLWYVVFVVAGTIAARNGEWYRYPLIFRFVRP